MKDLNAQIGILSEKIEATRRKAVFSTKLTAIVYGLLVLFVFAYTNLVINQLKKAATPDNLSAQMKMVIQQQLPGLRQNAIKYAKDSTPQMADYLVESTKQMIPMVEDQIKSLIDGQIDNILVSLKSDILPKFVAVIDENAEAINMTAESIKDQSVADALALVLVEELEKEMDKLFNEQFKHALGKLQDELDKLYSTPASELTLREAVERRLIVSWVFLLEHGDTRGAVIGNVLEKLGHYYEYLSGQFETTVLGDPESL